MQKLVVYPIVLILLAFFVYSYCNDSDLNDFYTKGKVCTDNTGPDRIEKCFEDYCYELCVNDKCESRTLKEYICINEDTSEPGLGVTRAQCTCVDGKCKEGTLVESGIRNDISSSLAKIENQKKSEEIADLKRINEMINKFIPVFYLSIIFIIFFIFAIISRIKENNNSI